jgi:hypothetical protein
MWFAVAIIGMIGIATGITLMPGSASKPTPAAAAPAVPAPAATPMAPAPASAPNQSPAK